MEERANKISMTLSKMWFENDFDRRSDIGKKENLDNPRENEKKFLKRNRENPKIVGNIKGKTVENNIIENIRKDENKKNIKEKNNILPIHIAVQITYNNLGTILNFILENSNITLDKIEVVIDKKTNFIIKIEFWQYGFQKNELSESDFLVLQPDKWFKKYEYFEFLNNFTEFTE